MNACTCLTTTAPWLPRVPHGFPPTTPHVDRMGSPRVATTENAAPTAPTPSRASTRTLCRSTAQHSFVQLGATPWTWFVRCVARTGSRKTCHGVQLGFRHSHGRPHAVKHLQYQVQVSLRRMLALRRPPMQKHTRAVSQVRASVQHRGPKSTSPNTATRGTCGVYGVCIYEGRVLVCSVEQWWWSQGG